MSFIDLPQLSSADWNYSPFLVLKCQPYTPKLNRWSRREAEMTGYHLLSIPQLRQTRAKVTEMAAAGCCHLLIVVWKTSRGKWMLCRCSAQRWETVRQDHLGRKMGAYMLTFEMYQRFRWGPDPLWLWLIILAQVCSVISSVSCQTNTFPKCY